MSSVDRLSKIKAVFNSKIKDFTQDMRVVLKGDGEATSILTALDAVVDMSPDLVVHIFKQQITDVYEPQILSRDEAFLKSEINTKLSGSSDTVIGPMDNLHHKINERWTTLDEKQKNMIWDYFKLLVILSKRI